MNNKLLIPGAIVIAGILIAVSFFVRSDSVDENINNPLDEKTVLEPVSSKDHILGNPEAAITIIEFSDIDCPACANFHPTMHSVIDAYGKNGDVAWVYRHFPLTQIHPNATLKAVASECVAELGGNDAFWDYLDILFERSEGVAELADIAEEIGIDKTSFENCLVSDSALTAVQKDFDGAQAAGVRSTPHSFVVTKDGQTIPVSGAQPIEVLRQIIDSALSEPTTTE